MTKNKKGFTIIEVVLVLAIAGLIFLMVFIALPALQRSQRNTRRRQDMARILSAFTEYASNNGGAVPDSNEKLSTFVNSYITGNSSYSTKDTVTTDTMKCGNVDQFCDPDGSSYYFNGIESGVVDKSSESFSHKIFYVQNATCSPIDEGKTVAGNGNRDIAILYALEGGAIYCGDNH